MQGAYFLFLGQMGRMGLIGPISCDRFYRLYGIDRCIGQIGFMGLILVIGQKKRRNDILWHLTNKCTFWREMILHYMDPFSDIPFGVVGRFLPAKIRQPWVLGLQAYCNRIKIRRMSLFDSRPCSFSSWTNSKGPSAASLSKEKKWGALHRTLLDFLKRL